MLTLVRRFLWDEAYATQQLKAALFLAATLVQTGVINLSALSETAGKWAWFIAPFAQALAVFIRNGERNTPAPPA